MDPIDADKGVRDSWRRLARATTRSFEAFDLAGVLDSGETKVTEAILLRMGAFYRAQYELKELLDRRVAAPGADYFADAILFFVKAALRDSAPELHAAAERTVAQRRGAMRPDISIWHGIECVAFIECKTQLGWARERWSTEFEARELRIKEHHTGARGYLVVMTTENWGGFGDDPRVGKQLFVLASKWPGFVEPKALRAAIVTPIEGLLSDLLASVA